MKLKQRTIYYQDELHDEFAGDHIKAKHIGQDYRYIRAKSADRNYCTSAEEKAESRGHIKWKKLK